ncbi:hypothetical protein DS745_06170 [Anaerobacillus alkaliphilus]|uniref:DUF2642 domain-containing protein n=1 Tax=Anaerobacillus alkaliphilus TaxID=1548597 RepID=A0A4Q0VUT6_9BACI|nr:hypothetical protein [Anaerobacillus alkaliphilus]RXJ02554.1 hypothetical protein DS745_06170 [Anaerobacillus alkaliphilus]
MEYIQSLKGSTCWVYQGGNETSFGKIVDTTEDFMVMHTESDEIIYYNIAHVKTICEDSTLRFVSLNCFENNEPEYVLAKNLHELLDKLKYRSVRISSGQDVRTGMLVEVKEDYIGIFTEEDGVTFYTSSYIHSISEPNRSASDITYQEVEFQTFQPMNSQIIGKNFNQLLTNLKFSWININRNRLDRIDGLLVEIYEDYLTLIQKQMVIRIPINQIRNVSFAGVSILKEESTINSELVIADDRDSIRDENLLSLSSETSNESHEVKNNSEEDTQEITEDVADEESSKKKQVN